MKLNSSPPTTAEIKNGFICLYVMVLRYRDSFAILYFILISHLLVNWLVFFMTKSGNKLIYRLIQKRRNKTEEWCKIDQEQQIWK
jgi:hypothetical protein